MAYEKRKRLFLKKVSISKPTECWPWNAAIDSGGYGWFSFPELNLARAHNASYVLFVGAIPEGMCVLHKCDNRICVNPNHLFLGTRGDNNRDRASKGRSFRPLGELSPSSKLTIELVKEIRKTKGMQKDIARKFGIHQAQVSRIKSAKRWPHVS